MTRGERFTDRNGNGRYDEGEPFEDRERKNGSWDPGEEYEDSNQNGKWDPDEPYQDRNHDGLYNPPESYDDLNGNGVYDVGPGVKITIARYYLPDGRCIHKERDPEGVVVEEGRNPAGHRNRQRSVARGGKKTRCPRSFRTIASGTTWNSTGPGTRTCSIVWPRLIRTIPRPTRTSKPSTRASTRSWIETTSAGGSAFLYAGESWTAVGREFVGLYFQGDFQEDRQAPARRPGDPRSAEATGPGLEDQGVRNVSRSREEREEREEVVKHVRWRYRPHALTAAEGRTTCAPTATGTPTFWTGENVERGTFAFRFRLNVKGKDVERGGVERAGCTVAS